MNKTIWMLWLQGRENAPAVVQRCIHSWEVNNPTWTLKLLTADTVSHYIDVTEFVDLQTQTLQAASLSDIIRIMLLHEYGGVWADATTLCNAPLDDWLPEVSGTGFFAFSLSPFPQGDRPLSSWFLAAEAGNSLVGKWAGRVHAYWQNRESSDDYFWFHHQFYELLEQDALALQAWQKVPRLSAAGPHSVQFNFGGLDQDAESVANQIDWSIPLFKLTHRIEPRHLKAGTILTHVLDRCAPDFSTWPPQTDISAVKVNCASYSLSTMNRGDHVQLIAGQSFMKRAGFVIEDLIDRDDEIGSAPGLSDDAQDVPILINGWHKHNATEWPPNRKLKPVFLGFHIRPHQCPNLLSDEAIEYYKAHEPIGCRDRFTQKLLSDRGVECFVSNCLSLSFSRRLPEPGQQTEIFVVSRDERLLDIVPRHLGPTRFINHYSETTSHEENMAETYELLHMYRQRGKLIITTLLHCALPAIAMGIPVIVLYPNNNEAAHKSDAERFSSLSRMIRVHTFDRVDEIDWRGQVVDTSKQKLEFVDAFLILKKSWNNSANSIGPIAPSSSLPVPHTNVWQERRKATTESLSKFYSDTEKWGHASQYHANWNLRADQASKFLPSGKSVFEIGMGAGAFADLVSDRCDYLGSDLSPLSPDALTLDVDKDEFPDRVFDYVVFLGVFEYLANPLSVSTKIGNSTSNIIASYCCRLRAGDAIHTRRRRGWATDFTEVEFLALFYSQGFTLTDKLEFNSTDDFTQSIFHLQRLSF